MERVNLSGYEALESLMRKRQEMEEAREERFVKVFGSLQEMGILPVLEDEVKVVTPEQSIIVQPKRPAMLQADILPVLNQILSVLQSDREEAARLRELERAVLDKLLAKLT